MRYSYALPALAALVSQAIAAPVVVTNTQVVYVTASAVTVQPSSSSVAPRLGNVLEVVVSELVEISGTNTVTHTSTYTRTAGQTASASEYVSAESSEVAEASTTIDSTIKASTASPSTTTLASSTRATSTTPTTSSTSSTSSTTSTTSSATPTSTSTSTTPTSTAPTTTSSSTTPKTTSSTSTSTSATATASSTSSLSDFASTILDAHNEKRALHGVADLTWSSTLAAYAQAYADKYDCSGSLTHSGGKYGENLALGYTTTGAVEAWYDEISYYDYSSPAASHFTQVVWKSTTELGCGYTTCGSYWGQYTICSYNPAGNVAGGYSANVLALV